MGRGGPGVLLCTRGRVRWHIHKVRLFKRHGCRANVAVKKQEKNKDGEWGPAEKVEPCT